MTTTTPRTTATLLVALFVMFFSSIALTSCGDSTYLGMDGELIKKPDQPTPPTPDDPNTVITLENVDLNAQFLTNIRALWSEDYYTKADYFKRRGEEILEQQDVKQDLDLTVLFSELPDVYVQTEAELSAVTLTGTSKSNSVENDQSARFGKLFTTSQDHIFRFDQNEELKGVANEQRLEYGDTIFPRAIIRSISFKEGKSVRNDKLSNNDSLVNNVSLYFNVDIELDRNVQSRAVDANVETYTVEVPYRRIYKTGYVAPTDEYVKTIILSSSETLNAGRRQFTVTTAEVWSVSGQKNENTETFSVPFGITAPAAKTIYSENANYTTTGNGLGNASESNKVEGNWSVTTRTQNYSSNASNGYDPFTNVYTVNDAKVVYTNKEAMVEFPYGTWTISEGNSTISGPTVSENYHVYGYVNNIDYIYAITSDNERGSAHANASIYVNKPQPKDEFVKNVLVSSSDKIEGNNRVITVTTAEVWSQSGQHESVTEKIELPIAFSNPAAQSVYTSNVNYSTRSNGWRAGNETSSTKDNFSVTTRSSSYSSSATNNDKAFNNVYTMSDAKVVYKNGDIVLNFGYGTWNVVEGESTVGAASVEGDYNVYPYANNVRYTYSISNDSKNGNGRATAKLYVEKPAEKIIPEAWGKIIGAGISAVPSDDLGEGTNVAKKCLTIRTDKGAVAVVFDWNNNICSVNNILNGYFVEGNFDASYNSGFFTTNTNRGSYTTGKWAPAKAQDLSDRIAYYNGTKCVRNVPFQTLKLWNWANGQSTVVKGYTFSVTADGTLKVAYNGQTILSVR